MRHFLSNLNLSGSRLLKKEGTTDDVPPPYSNDKRASINIQEKPGSSVEPKDDLDWKRDNWVWLKREGKKTMTEKIEIDTSIKAITGLLPSMTSFNGNWNWGKTEDKRMNIFLSNVGDINVDIKFCHDPATKLTRSFYILVESKKKLVCHVKSAPPSSHAMNCIFSGSTIILKIPREYHGLLELQSSVKGLHFSPAVQEKAKKTYENGGKHGYSFEYDQVADSLNTEITPAGTTSTTSTTTRTTPSRSRIQLSPPTGKKAGEVFVSYDDEPWDGHNVNKGKA